MKLIICSLALCAALEGIGFAAAPGLMKKALKEMSGMDVKSLRFMGILALITAVILAFIGGRLS